MLATACLLLSLTSAPLLAQVYKWTDAEGRVHYGDRPPAEASSRRLDTGRAPSADAVREQQRATAIIRREAEILASDRARIQAEVDREAARAREIAATYRAFCDTAREELRVLDSGGAVYYDGENGEREFIDDDARAARITQLRTEIAEHCQ